MNFYTLVFVGLFFGLMVIFTLINKRRDGDNLRDIPSFYRLKGAIELAVEDGSRIHIAIGRGDITSPQAGAALVALSILQQVSRIASEGDNPPVATAGDGVLMILAQDTIRSTYQEMGMSPSYSNDLGRMAGVTPFSYAAGTMPLIIDEEVSATIMAGTFSNEAALITSAGERRQSLTIAGTDSIPGQAILYATANEPLIGEELYAGGAYIGGEPLHVASLHAQDVIRWIIVVLLIFSAIAGFLGGLF